MSVVSGSNSLSLRLEILGDVHEFVLKDGESVVLGRDKSCQIVLDNDSISTRHLELRWHNKKLEIKDLESSNGTFRMPQDSPFLEAKLELQQQGVDLRLAKLPLNLQWKLVDPLSGPAKVKSEPQVKDESQDVREKYSEKQKRAGRLGLRDRTIFYSGVSFLLLVALMNGSEILPLLSPGMRALKTGLGFDVLEVLISNLPTWGAMLAVVGVLAWVLMGKLKENPVYQTKYSRSRLLSFSGICILCAPLLSPLVVLGVMGNPVEKWNDYQGLKTIEKVLVDHDFSSRENNLRVSKILRENDSKYVGSSVFYSILYNFQKKRAVKECAGLGESAWTKKRFCLVLLYALSVETYAVVKPLYFIETSSTLVLLSSLDGIVRVLAAEGPESKYLELFLKSLDKVGLNKELVTLKRFVKSFRGKSFDELMRALLDLRLVLERRVVQLQKENAFPKRYALDLRGPLEMGI